MELKSEEKMVKMELKSEEKMVKMELKSEEKMVKMELKSEEKMVKMELKSEEKMVKMELKSEEEMVSDQFIYFVTFLKIWRFNVRTLHCCRAELIKDFSDCSSPIGMGGVLVNSKLCMFGGEKIKEGSNISAAVYMPGFMCTMQAMGFNKDVFELDPTNLQVPLVPVRGDDFIPRMNAPKICPIVATIGDRIYVLSSLEPLYNFTDYISPRLIFEAYDRSTKSWMELDPPPYYEKPQGNLFTAHYVWGNRLFLRTPLGYFFFDVKDNTWHSTKGKFFDVNDNTWRSTKDDFIKQFRYPVFPPSGRLVAFKNFLIGVDFWPRHHPFPVFAYRFDHSDPLLFKSYIPLHEFGKVVDHSLYDCSGHINHLGDGDDGRMCLLLSGIVFDSNKKKHAIVRIVTFQVQVSHQFVDADDDDSEVLSALVDDPATFNLGVVGFTNVVDHESVFVLLGEVSGRRGGHQLWKKLRNVVRACTALRATLRAKRKSPWVEYSSNVVWDFDSSYSGFKRLREVSGRRGGHQLWKKLRNVVRACTALRASLRAKRKSPWVEDSSNVVWDFDSPYSGFKRLRVVSGRRGGHQLWKKLRNVVRACTALRAPLRAQRTSPWVEDSSSAVWDFGSSYSGLIRLGEVSGRRGGHQLWKKLRNVVRACTALRAPLRAK